MTSYADPAHRYELTRRIATGGMGEVWRALDTVLGREVAVKLLKPEYADDPSFRTRFETEARHAAALHHPGVAAVFDFGDGEDHRPYLVMELVDGQPLSALLRAGQPMPPEQTRELILQAADAVAAAHAKGIVHRDVKPANLLVTPDRTLKITDFGIARAADGMALTQTGQVMGTPQYLSPEQAEGGTATAASDVYSLGVVLFECLAGERPFRGDSPVATALAHIREPIPDLPPSVPGDLAAVVRKCLAKNPQERFRDAAVLAAALRNPSSVPPLVPAPAVVPAGAGETAVLTGLPPATGFEVTPVGPAEDQPRRGISPWWSLVPIVLLLALVAWALWQNLEDDPEPSGSTDPTSSAPTTRTQTTRNNDVTLDSDVCEGNIEDVARSVERLDLRVDREPQENPGDEQPGKVIGCNPTGLLQRGDVVTVSFWDEAPETTAPTEPTTRTKPGKPSKSGTDTTTSTATTDTTDPTLPGNGTGNGRSRGTQE